MPFRLLPLRGAALLVAAAAVGCQGAKPPPPAPPPPKVSVAHPVVRTLSDYGEYTGYTDAIQRVEIRPQVKGRVLKVHVKEGTEITAGTPLYDIDPSEYMVARDDAKAALDRAVADQKRAAAERDRADASLARLSRLGTDRGVSQEELDQATANARTTAAAVGQADAAIEQAKAKLARAELDLGYTKIVAPISGRVSRTLVTEGNLVGYDQPTQLTVMVDVDPIYVYFDVPERDAIKFEREAKANNRPLWSAGKIPLEVGVETEDGYPHKGVINFRDPRFEPGTGTIRLRGIVANDARTLSSGMFARVRFPLGPPRDRLMVPSAAVLSDQRGRYVLVVNKDNVAEYRAVTLGPRVDPMVAVEEGLKADDWVIVNGVQKARPKTAVAPDRQPLEAPAIAEKK